MFLASRSVPVQALRAIVTRDKTVPSVGGDEKRVESLVGTGGRAVIDEGYAIAPSVFAATDIATVGAALENADLARTRAGARNVMRVPIVRSLASDERLISLASRFIGPGPVAFRATLFDKSSRSNWLISWHQDTALPLRTRVTSPFWGPWTTKSDVLHAIAPAEALAKVIALRVHLDDSTLLNGPLRVVPRSHGDGILSQAQIQHLAESVGAVDCLAPRGGVVAMRPLTVHASSKARDGRSRRVLHIEYACEMTMPYGAELAFD